MNKMAGSNPPAWPACVGVEDAARILGWPSYFIPVLHRLGHLKPLGKPAANAKKWFTTCELERLRQDPVWLDKAVRLVEKHVQEANRQQRERSLRLETATTPERVVA